MNVAKVLGNLVATQKDPKLKGYKILCIEPLGGREPALFAIDAVGAGAGETVLYTTGREASFAFLPDIVPCNTAIVGIVDEIREQTK